MGDRDIPFSLVAAFWNLLRVVLDEHMDDRELTLAVGAVADIVNARADQAKIQEMTAEEVAARLLALEVELEQISNAEGPPQEHIRLRPSVASIMTEMIWLKVHGPDINGI